MSSTEREALEAGTLGFEKQLFDGKLDFQAFFAEPKAKFTPEEKHFFENELQELCRLLNDWEITHEKMDLSPEAWNYIKEKRFLGLIIPKQYGGLDFSASALVKVLTQLSGKSVSAGITVGVANSLGPAELLLQYGTEEQKNYYLPRLAKGEEIPCFALTSPEAGSDAASIPDRGVVCRREWQGKMTLGINLNWNKRYITLCPVATVMGLAFQLLDPEHLLGDKEYIGITCALIPSNTPGITKGRRHFPLGTAFLNGPTQGKDVFIPMDWIIGGAPMAGTGWRMLMECLSAGRAISLPSGAVGNAQGAALASGAYARIRQQFGMPIAHFEGIEAALAKVGGYTYMINAASTVTAASLDQGAKPAVLSAILKCYTTEFSRRILLEAMDIHGGKAICLGPKNYLARGFESSPIAITVEGANILTRNLIIYGQGAVRCHPFINEEIISIAENDVPRFHRAVLGHIKMVFVHFGRILSPYHAGGEKNYSKYIKQIRRLSIALAFISDLSMIVLGSQLKRKERISARLADALSFLYIASTVLKNHQDEGAHEEDLPYVQWSCETLFHDTEEALWTVMDNLSQKGLSRYFVLFFKRIIFPLGRRCKKPSDSLEHKIADLMTHDTPSRERLTKHVFKENLPNHPLGQLEAAFKKVLAVEPIERKMIQAIKSGTIESCFTREERAELALAKGVITQSEADAYLDAEKARKDILGVDDFASLR